MVRQFKTRIQIHYVSDSTTIFQVVRRSPCPLLSPQTFMPLLLFFLLEELLSLRGLMMRRRRARNTSLSFASSFGKYFSVTIVYSLSSFSVSKFVAFSLGLWTRSTRFTCFLTTACRDEDAFVLQGQSGSEDRNLQHGIPEDSEYRARGQYSKHGRGCAIF